MSNDALGEDFVLPIGVAKIERTGSHITLVSFSNGVKLALDGANELEKLGVQAEVKVTHGVGSCNFFLDTYIILGDKFANFTSA
jgi:pyruvate/2-oxoglutarate/acetoin dehydrogenase E1 component